MKIILNPILFVGIGLILLSTECKKVGRGIYIQGYYYHSNPMGNAYEGYEPIYKIKILVFVPDSSELTQQKIIVNNVPYNLKLIKRGKSPFVNTYFDGMEVVNDTLMSYKNGDVIEYSIDKTFTQTEIQSLKGNKTTISTLFKNKLVKKSIILNSYKISVVM